MSTLELLALCKCAKVNVIIVQRLDHTLVYERHSITEPNKPTLITSIISNRRGNVRSHFERVVSGVELQYHRDVEEQLKRERNTMLDMEVESKRAAENAKRNMTNVVG